MEYRDNTQPTWPKFLLITLLNSLAVAVAWTLLEYFMLSTSPESSVRGIAGLAFMQTLLNFPIILMLCALVLYLLLRLFSVRIKPSYLSLIAIPISLAIVWVVYVLI